MLQLLSCSNSKIYFRTRSNYVAPEEDCRPSERVASLHIVGRRPIGTASDSESKDDDTDDGAEGFSQDSALVMTSSQLSSSSASANSAPAPSAASRRPEVVEETSADILSMPSGRKPVAGKRRRKGPGKEATMGGGTNLSLPLSIIWSVHRKNCHLHQRALVIHARNLSCMRMSSSECPWWGHSSACQLRKKSWQRSACSPCCTNCSMAVHSRLRFRHFRNMHQ